MWLIVVGLTILKLAALVVIAVNWVAQYPLVWYFAAVRYVRDYVYDGLFRPVINFWYGLFQYIRAWHDLNMWVLGVLWFLFVDVPLWIPL